MLDLGEIETDRDMVHVDCTALGLCNAPATPVFQPDRIVLQEVRQNSPTFNSALIGFVEAARDNDADKNRLCPPNPHASSIEDWPRMTRRTWKVEQRWPGEPDVWGWVSKSRLNLLRALPDHAAESSVKQALERFVAHVGEADSQLSRFETPYSSGE